MTDYLTVVEVITIPADQIERYGVRDRGLLEAALFRPQTGYYADLIEEAVALWESLAQNRPFIDGNKRTLRRHPHTFLAINGARMTASADDTYAFIIALYEAGTFELRHLTQWLRETVVPDAEGA